jgi:hypothetical protein
MDADTKPGPMSVAALDESTGHWWVRQRDLAPWYPTLALTFPDHHACLVCGVFRRADGKSKPCKGAPKITMRAAGGE